MTVASDVFYTVLVIIIIIIFNIEDFMRLSKSISNQFIQNKSGMTFTLVALLFFATRLSIIQIILLYLLYITIYTLIFFKIKKYKEERDKEENE